MRNPRIKIVNIKNNQETEQLNDFIKNETLLAGQVCKKCLMFLKNMTRKAVQREKCVVKI